jgi:hypothetical protein
MKSDKLKKLLKQIKKLKKLRKLKKNKKSQKYLKVNAEIENLKEKIKLQEIQMSQIKSQQQIPVSTVRYEKMDGQQNALNQSNLENIQKSIETKLINHPLVRLQSADQNNKYSDIINGIESGQYKIKPTKYGMTITNPGLYKKVGRKPKIVLNKSIEEVNESSGVKSKINTNKSTPQNPLYKYDDNAGEFPVTDFNKDINTIDQIPDINEPSIEINQPFTSAFTDESESQTRLDIKDVGETIKQTKVRKSTKGQPKQDKPTQDKPLSNAQLRKLKKDRVQPPPPPVVSNELGSLLKDVPPLPDLSGLDRLDKLTAFSDN